MPILRPFHKWPQCWPWSINSQEICEVENLNDKPRRQRKKAFHYFGRSGLCLSKRTRVVHVSVGKRTKENALIIFLLKFVTFKRLITFQPIYCCKLNTFLTLPCSDSYFTKSIKRRFKVKVVLYPWMGKVCIYTWLLENNTSISSRCSRF